MKTYIIFDLHTNDYHMALMNIVCNLLLFIILQILGCIEYRTRSENLHLSKEFKEFESLTVCLL